MLGAWANRQPAAVASRLQGLVPANVCGHEQGLPKVTPGAHEAEAEGPLCVSVTNGRCGAPTPARCRAQWRGRPAEAAGPEPRQQPPPAGAGAGVAWSFNSSSASFSC